MYLSSSQDPNSKAKSEVIGIVGPNLGVLFIEQFNY